MISLISMFSLEESTEERYSERDSRIRTLASLWYERKTDCYERLFLLKTLPVGKCAVIVCKQDFMIDDVL